MGRANGPFRNGSTSSRSSRCVPTRIKLFLATGILLIIGLSVMTHRRLPVHEPKGLEHPLQSVPAVPAKNRAAQLKVALAWYAPFRSLGPSGSEATALVLALQRRMHVRLLMHGDDALPSARLGVNTLSRNQTEALREAEFEHLVPATHTVAVCHSSPLQWKGTQDVKAGVQNGCPHHSSRYKIGRTPALLSMPPPPGWVHNINTAMHEVWVPSEHDRRALRSAGVQLPVNVIPESIDCRLWSREDTGKVPWMEESDAFRLLSVIRPAGPDAQNKGWHVLVEAFLREFSADDNVTLHILTDGGDPELIVDFVMSLDLGDEALPTITFLPTKLLDSELRDVYGGAHALVQTARGADWGRAQIMQALCMKLPVIATQWPDVAEFLNVSIGFPVPPAPCSPVANGTQCGPPHPPVAQLRTVMRSVVRGGDGVRHKAELGRTHMAALFCPDCVAKRVEQALRIAGAREGFIMGVPPQTKAPLTNPRQRVLQARVRPDDRCGGAYPAPDGRGPGECIEACCSPEGTCGSTTLDCCLTCPDFRQPPPARVLSGATTLTQLRLARLNDDRQYDRTAQNRTAMANQSLPLTPTRPDIRQERGMSVCDRTSVYILTFTFKRPLTRTDFFDSPDPAYQDWLLHFWASYHRANTLGYFVMVAHNDVIPLSLQAELRTSCVDFTAFKPPAGRDSEEDYLWNSRFYGVLHVLKQRKYEFVMHMDMDVFCYWHPFRWLRRFLGAHYDYVAMMRQKTKREIIFVQGQLTRCFPQHRINATHLYFITNSNFASRYAQAVDRVEHVIGLLESRAKGVGRAVCDMGAMALSYMLHDLPHRTRFLWPRAFPPTGDNACGHHLAPVSEQCMSVFKRTHRTNIFHWTRKNELWHILCK